MIVWLVTLNVLALLRLWVFQSDAVANRRRILIAAMLHGMFLVIALQHNVAAFVFIAWTAGVGLVPLATERSKKWHVHYRLIIFLGYAAVAAYLLSDHPAVLERLQSDHPPRLNMELLRVLTYPVEHSIFAPRLAATPPELRWR